LNPTFGLEVQAFRKEAESEVTRFSSGVCKKRSGG
jgi:hypothetical protein